MRPIFWVLTTTILVQWSFVSGRSIEVGRVMTLQDDARTEQQLIQQHLRIMIHEPQVDPTGMFTTFVSEQATSLLTPGPGSLDDNPALFIGTAPRKTMQYACELFELIGDLPVPGYVHAYGIVSATTFAISQVDGCSTAHEETPSLMAGVLTNQHGERLAVVCDPGSSLEQCSVYIVTNFLDELYKNLHRRRKLHVASMFPLCDDGRADCAAWGSIKCSITGVAHLCPCMCGSGDIDTPTPSFVCRVEPEGAFPEICQNLGNMATLCLHSRRASCKGWIA